MRDWWTAGMTPEQKAEFKDAYRIARPVLERLQEKLNKELNATESALESSGFLELFNLEHRRTSKLAERRKLKEVLRLIEN